MSKLKQIFYDKRRIRHRYSLRTLISVGLFFFAIFFVTVISIFRMPKLPILNLGDPQLKYRAATGNSDENIPKQDSFAFEEAMEKANDIKTEAAKNNATTSRPKIIGFYVNWDDNSFTSLKASINKIDVLIPEWLHIADQSGNLLIDNQIRQDETLGFIRQNRGDLKIIPLINNFNSQTQSWDAQIISRILEDPTARSNCIQKIYEYVKANGFSGISIDFESILDKNHEQLFLFMQELYTKFHADGLEVSQNIPLQDDSYDVKKLSTVSDYLILMAYDEYHSNGNPGPISSNDWYWEFVSKRFSDIMPNKFVIALGNYGYDWKVGGDVAETLSFQDAIRIAKESEGQIEMDKKSLNPKFNYYDENEKLHHVWYLDSVTAFNQMIIGGHFGNPYGYALWRMGSEDPNVWDVFDAREKLDFSIVDKMSAMEYGYDLVYEGEGEILKLSSIPEKGLRKLMYDQSKGLITKQSVIKYPSSYVITRWGAKEKKIAITFDDGPDKEYTPQILEILKAYNVSATFFVVGVNANINTDIIKKIYANGNEIGVHTYTHPNIAAISKNQLKIELDASERLIESVIGRRSLLFRPPYAEDIEPANPEHVKPLVSINESGFYTIGMHIDPKDWSKPGADQLAEKVIGDAKSGKGNIILLHDSGGDRSHTVEALPKIIEGLQKEGFDIVTVSELMGIGRDTVMPVISRQEFFLSRINNAAFAIVSNFSKFMRDMFLAGIILGSIRFLFITVLAVIQSLYPKCLRYKSRVYYKPSVSVVIPAYNEERVICKTVDALLLSVYKKFNIIIVDDGSTDGTYEKISKKYGNHEKVEIYTKSNGGKAGALNFGIAKTKASIIITLDADTLFKENTIKNIIQPFADSKVAAVAGNAKVGNRTNLLTKWQALEYITTQNLDRRAFEMLNCISVVPGAVGAWRRRDILKAGGFSSQTLAEDADLTFSILRTGKRIIYEDQAVGFTEAPESTRNFLKQRFRWMYGTLQTVWKHKDTVFRLKYKALGNFSIPNVFVFQILFPLISPFMDLMLVFSFVWIGWQKYSHPQTFSSATAFREMLLYYVLFLTIDLLTGMIPFLLEKKENWSLLLWLPLQRFYYRQLMYYVAIKSLFVAIAGTFVRWNKFERKATVSQVATLGGKNLQ